jgi:nucleotide-binding universal stress UspA family protein
MAFERIIVVADEFSTSDRPFALARHLASAGNLTVEVVYGVLDGELREATPGWRLQRRLDAHGLSAAELRVLRADEPELAVCEHLAGHDGSLILRSTSAGGHDGGPLRDRTAEAIMSHLPHPVLLLGPRQANPRGDARLSPITVRDGASEVASLDSATEIWISTFTNTQPELLEVLPPDPWPPSGVDPGPNVREARSGTVLTELRTVDLSDAVLSHLNGRRDAVVVVSSPRWSSTPSHWWSTARRLVRHLSCPLLVVPMVGPH